ncbi:MAG: hypothetical protein ACW9W4_01980 [Candidatus Nitrosopumilus sp. bin_7KS]
MKIGFIISMYDEIKKVNETIRVVKRNNCPVIVIQSDPKNENELLDENTVEHYELLEDLAGNKEQYVEERKHMDKGTTIPAYALSRNYNQGFSAAKKFDVDWWVAILGDVEISNLLGIEKIIGKISQNNKLVGVTRAVGQIWPDDNFEFTRIQKKTTTDFMPQFFIVSEELIKEKTFEQIKVTNKYASEQCLGDAVVQYCKDNSTTFDNVVFSICDYAYPKFIAGLKYNPVQARLPRYVDGAINAVRRIRVKFQY